jgi:hypothetical protein
MKIAYLVLAAAIFVISTAAGLAAETDPCINPPVKDIGAVFSRTPSAKRPDILPTTRFLPAGAYVDIVLQFDSPQESPVTYRAIVDGARIRPLNESAVSAQRITPEDSVVKDGIVASENVTNARKVTVRVPDEGLLWPEVTLYVYGCTVKGDAAKGEASSPTLAFWTNTTVQVSNKWVSSSLVWLFLVVAYLLLACAAWKADKKKADKNSLSFLHYLDPVVLTAGADGRGSLSKLQILFFSLIVVGLVGYIVCRTGILTELSPTILLLLGIAGVGSTAAKATDVNRNRIDFDNWVWFINKKWLLPGGLAEENNAKWQDLVTTSGEFNVYNFQNLIFGFVVGGALIVAGLSDLSSFSIPTTLLGIIGLSQVIYVGGKLTAPSFKELNDATKALRDLESDFIATSAKTPDPTAPPDAPLLPPKSLDEARRRAPDKYQAYINKAKDLRLTFISVTGLEKTIPDNLLEPAFS